MGEAINKISFDEQEYVQFSQHLQANLQELKQLLARSGFGKGPGSFGAELEVYIIDEHGKAFNRNTEILEAMHDEQVTLELNRFNLEYNLKPVAHSQRPFASSETNLLGALGALRTCAAGFQARILPVGILPTLSLQDFDHRTMTDLPRFHALRNKLRAERDGLFRIDIQGEDQLSLATDDITLEGANTSFQVHHRVDPEDFADIFNAIQLVTPLVTAIASNSPIVFGKRLWHETRIPLFKKSIDSRSEEALESLRWQQAARVNFGHGWVRNSAYELFAETVRLYPPLLPIIPAQPEKTNSTPALRALRLHQGTVWLWNRPIYDDVDGGHLRIEMRALPSGPTVVDMIANAALLIGLAEGLREQIRELITALPFRHCTQNFYRAAQQGIGASLVWPHLEQSRLEATPVVELIDVLLPVADRGLQSIGIDSEERSRYLGVIADRLTTRTTGASWQLDCMALHEQHMERPEALHRMLELYYQQSLANTPVARWHLKE